MARYVCGYVSLKMYLFLGCDTLIALLSHERDDDAPKLLLVLAECFTAVYLALFSYAFVAYDSRWLYRLAAHPIDQQMFSRMFGGGGKVILRQPVVASAQQTG